MAITIHQSASLNSNAYNRNEYVLSSNYSAYPKFKYNFNILYSLATISAYSPAQLNGLVYTKFTISNDYFVVGDKVFISGNEVGNVLEIDLTAGTIIVDISPDNLVISLGTTTVSKVIAHTIDKEPQTALGIINISNTLKSFCTHELIDTPNLYWSDNVLFRYNLVYGESYEFIHTFTDNVFSTGSVGFNNSTLSASYTASMPFQIGDQIIIQQDLYEWPYTDNLFYSGSLGFTGSSAVPFATGSQVYVTGQVTNQYYNGYSTVIAGTSGSRLVTDKTFGVSSPTEGGIIYGTPQPTYNDVATITDIYYTSSLGVVIVTDLPYGTSSPAIGGTIKYADGRLVRNYETPTPQRLVSTGKFDKLQEQSLNSTNYHLNNQISSSQYVSSIVSFQDSTYKHRVEQNTKGWMLLKPALRTDSTLNTGSLTIKYKFYNDSNTLLGTGSFGYSSAINFTNNQNISGSASDYFGIYVPMGLDQLNTSTHFTSSLNSYISSVDSYKLEVTNSIATTQPITFELNPDCGGGYDVYHLLFKDSMGSWLPIPFKYKSFTSTETSTKSYYAKEGNINAQTSQVDYTSYDRGRTNIYKRYTDKFKLTSGWLNESENSIMKDMLTSPEVYIQDPQNNIRAVQLLNTELDLSKKDNVQIFNYTFDVAMSIDELRF